MGVYGIRKYGRPAVCPKIFKLLEAHVSGSVSPDLLTPASKQPRTKSPRIKSPTEKTINVKHCGRTIKVPESRFIADVSLAVATLRDLYNLDGYKSNLEPVSLIKSLLLHNRRKRQIQRNNAKRRKGTMQEWLKLQTLKTLQLQHEEYNEQQRQKCKTEELQDLIDPIVNSYKSMAINNENNAENTTAKPSVQDNDYSDEYCNEMAARTGAYPKRYNRNANTSNNNEKASGEVSYASSQSDEMDDYSKEIAARTGAYAKRYKSKADDGSSTRAQKNRNECNTEQTENELCTAMKDVLANIHFWEPEPQKTKNYQPLNVQTLFELSPTGETSHPWHTINTVSPRSVAVAELPDEPEEPAQISPFVFCCQCNSIARIHCRTCAIVMCNKCFCGHNPSHNSAQFQRQQPNGRSYGLIQYDRCPKHGLGITQVCNDCNVCMCDQCYLTKHAGHKRVTFVRFALKVERHLRNTVSDGCASIAIIRQSIVRAALLMKNLNQDHHHTHEIVRRAVFKHYSFSGYHHSVLLMDAETIRFTYTQYIQRYMYALQESFNMLNMDIAQIDRALNSRQRPDMSDFELASAALESRRRVMYFKKVMAIPLQPLYMGIGMTSISGSVFAELTINDDPMISQTLLLCTRRSHQPQLPTPYINPYVMNKTCHLDREQMHSWSLPSQAIWNLPDLLAVRLETQPSLSFACESPRPGDLNRPWGVCVDSYGHIIIGDRRNNRVQMFDQDGKLVRQFGCKGRNNGEFDLPAGVCVDISQKIYVVDKDNHRVQVFTNEGVYLFKFGTFGCRNGQFQYPWDVAVNTAGEVVVSDSRNHRIQLFSPRGRFLSKLCFKSLMFMYQPKNYTTPRGVCFTPNGDVIVTDFEHHRLILVDGRLQRVKAIRGRSDEDFLNLSRPSGVCCDDDGRVIVADSKNARLMVFSPDLDYIISIDVRPTYGPGFVGRPELSERDRPCDVAILPNGRLVVIVESSPETRHLVFTHKTFCKIY